jgi:hypothetical protein
MPQAGEIRSNLKRVTMSYDEEMSLPQEQIDFYNSLSQDGESPEEMWDAVDEQYELAYAAAAPSRWEGQERWQGRENEEMRLVNILHPHAVFRKLQGAGVDARIEAPSYWVWSIDDQTGQPVQVKRERTIGRIWLNDFVVQGRVGVSAWVWDTQLQMRRRKLITSLQYPCGPEWTLMKFDEWNVPTVERYRGWRTALLALIQNDVITEEEVDRAFGPVVMNDASLLYRKKLQKHRMKRMGLIQ